MDKKYEVKFSGNKQEFKSGATRDNSENKGRFDLIPSGPLRRLALVYEQGAKNHQPHNWEKGFNFSRALDSALRHINQWKDGQRDEDHLLNAVWNLFAIGHFEEMIERGLLPKELNDLPNYQVEKVEQKFDEAVEEELAERPLDGGYNNLIIPDENYKYRDDERFWDNGTMFQSYWRRK